MNIQGLVEEAAVILEPALREGVSWWADAFSILAPMWGLALCGLWGARYGRFGPRTTPNGPRIEQNAGHG